jgi:hypothetical protein
MTAQGAPPVDAGLAQRVMAVIEAGEGRGEHLATIAYRAGCGMSAAYQAVTVLLVAGQIGATTEPGHIEAGERLSAVGRYWPRWRPPEPRRGRRRG